MKHDEDRVFDISKPHKKLPQATSKPVIVGHHPVMNDPMVTMDRPTEPPHTDKPATPIKVAITVQDGHAPSALEEHSANTLGIEDADSPSVEVHKTAATLSAEPATASKLPELSEHHPMAVYPQHDISNADSAPAADATEPTAPLANTLPVAAVADAPEATPSVLNDLPLPAHHGSHTAPPSSKSKSRNYSLIVLILLILLGVYGYVDAKTSISLPFYIFRKTTPAVAPVATPTPAKTVPATTNPYNGWNSLTFASEKLTFKYPPTWKLTDNTAAKTNLDSNGVSYGDSVTLAGDNGFTVIAEAGQQAPNDTSGYSVDQSDPVTFATQPAKLNLLELGKQSTGSISEIELVKSDGTLFPAKNVPVVADRQSKAEYVQVLANYGTDASGSLSVKTLAFVEADANYKNLKLVIQSMSY